MEYGREFKFRVNVRFLVIRVAGAAILKSSSRDYANLIHDILFNSIMECYNKFECDSKILVIFLDERRVNSEAKLISKGKRLRSHIKLISARLCVPSVAYYSMTWEFHIWHTC